MGGSFALIGGFVGLVGLAAMIANLRTTAADPIGILLFSALLINGLVAVWRKVTGREEAPRRAKGPFTGSSKRMKKKN